MSIALMVCFARSGGTVLNQCLGCLPNVVILSEVNPTGGGSGKGDIVCDTVKSQSAHWYGIDIKSNDFSEGILELEEICKQNNKKLVVRDWSFINFTPSHHNNWKPAYKLLSLEQLKGKTKIKAFAFVRDSIDVWISRGMPDCDVFFQDYLQYAREITEQKLTIFRYEDFCINPEKTLSEICKFAELEYSNFLDKYQSFDKVNGDIQIISRGREKSFIRPLPRKIISREKIYLLNHCEAMIQANQLLGYPTSYYDIPRENLWIKGFKSLSKKLG